MLTALLLCLLSGTDENSSSRSPNVILILTDDLGYGDLGCYGATDLSTPHLDRMADEGTRFTDFSVVAPLCTPSRVSFMSGRYPGRVGLATGVLRPESQIGLPGGEFTLGELFHNAGYATCYIGKWHLGFVPGLRPMDQGFEHYFGVLHNLDPPETAFFESQGGTPILRGDEVIARPAVPARLTGLYTTEALSFIDSHRERPFFLLLSHQMPHKPFDASPAFRGKSARGLYGDVIEELDGSTGQILDRLRALGLADRTLVLFTSDNGPERNTTGSAGALRGTKHTVYEGGLRVPLIAWWPAHVPAGRESDAFLTALDLLPTLSSLTGARRPEGAPPLDGLDCSAVMLGKPGADSPRSTLFSLYGYLANRRISARRGDWKLHLTDRPELYDLSQDLSEQRNLAAQHPDIVRELTEAYTAWRTETNTP